MLLVEDDPGDVLIAREALEERKLLVEHLHVVTDGEEAVAYLRARGGLRRGPPARPHPARPQPRPGSTAGRSWPRSRTDPELRRIPVVVLTTSRGGGGRAARYDLHANAYVTKPVDFERFIEVVRQIDDFFGNVAGSLPD